MNNKISHNEEYPYMVEASREDSPLAIDDIVWDLLELASPFEGNYDGYLSIAQSPKEQPWSNLGGSLEQPYSAIKNK